MRSRAVTRPLVVVLLCLLPWLAGAVPVTHGGTGVTFSIPARWKLVYENFDHCFATSRDGAVTLHIDAMRASSLEDLVPGAKKELLRIYPGAQFAQVEPAEFAGLRSVSCSGTVTAKSRVYSLKVMVLQNPRVWQETGLCLVVFWSNLPSKDSVPEVELATFINSIAATQAPGGQ